MIIGLPDRLADLLTHRYGSNGFALYGLPVPSRGRVSGILGVNGIGSGEVQRLAEAEPEQLYADFFRYGESIGKNLKYGNEIENSHRIAKIVPRVVNS